MNNKESFIVCFVIALIVGVSTFFITNAIVVKFNSDTAKLSSNNRKNIISNRESTTSDNGTEEEVISDSVAYGGEVISKTEESVDNIISDKNGRESVSNNEVSLVHDSSASTISDGENDDFDIASQNYVLILSAPTTLNVGDKVTLTVDSSSNADLQYVSENPSVVSIDSKGVVTAERMGTAIVTVSLYGEKDSVSINVLEPTVAAGSNLVIEESSKTASKTQKNGWVNQNGNRYYYKDGVAVTGWKSIDGDKYYFNKKGIMQKDTYIDYHYLKSNGKKKEKIGCFSVTIYGAIAWANQTLNVRSSASKNGKIVGTVAKGSKIKILSDVIGSTGYIKIRRGNTEGYVYANNLMINLPDVIPDMYYSISNADSSKFKAAGTNISGVTGNNLYGFEKKYNAKIGKSTYYAPMLYPVAVQLNNAYRTAKKQGYNLKVYDTYRPYDVSMKVAGNLRTLYNSNSKVRSKIDYDLDGNYWGQGWFVAQGVSTHNRGTAIDLALTDSSGRELKAQSSMHALDTTSLVKYNNDVSKKLRSLMVSSGFETLKSEWWHFQEDNYRNSPYVNFKLK